jgi:hypothetical protein
VTAPPSSRPEADASVGPRAGNDEDGPEDYAMYQVGDPPNPTQPNPTQPNPTQPNPTQPNPTQPLPLSVPGLADSSETDRNTRRRWGKKDNKTNATECEVPFGARSMCGEEATTKATICDPALRTVNTQARLALSQQLAHAACVSCILPPPRSYSPPRPGLR